MLERIGSGSMGVVWRARDERLERVVAVKQLLPQPGLTDEQKQDARRRALREARIAARLHHPNAIVVFDVAEHDGDPCLVMEYLPARSMAAMLAERGSMPAADVAAVGGQIASALAAAHASGIVHRDVKPANILITDEGVAKITDFGIARAAGDVQVTKTGMFAGTPAYLAPEVARGQDPTTASDVFSFGASLYDAVEGGPPFPERQNQLALLRLVAEGKVQPPRQAGMLTALLMQLLRPEADERPTMGEASRMLADLAEGRSVPLAAPPIPRAQPTQPDIRPLAEQGVPTPAAPVYGPPVPVASRPVLSDRPAAYRPTASSVATAQRQPVDRRLVLIAVLLVVVVLVVLGVVLLLNNGSTPTNNAGGGGATTTTSAPPTTTPATTTPAATTAVVPVGHAVSSGTIAFQPAGQLVVNYFDDISNTAGRYALLTPGAQAAFGGLSGFEQYWGKFSDVSSAHAIGVTTNADGSVEVPIQVSYTTTAGAKSTVQKTMRVVQEGGKLLIDDNAM
ncbi:MAG TPA: serine/threonine-protein kinase [Pseudonocardiaceae bacterium]|nr:serine/threonine-protein kinase [Pseudonocardiaceae bacterium]